MGLPFRLATFAGLGLLLAGVGPVSAKSSRPSELILWAGSVARLRLNAFLGLTAQGAVEVAGARGSDFGGLIFTSSKHYGVAIRPLPSGCRFSGPACVEVPSTMLFGTHVENKIAGVPAAERTT
jgi:hypothetical protein